MEIGIVRLTEKKMAGKGVEFCLVTFGYSETRLPPF